MSSFYCPQKHPICVSEPCPHHLLQLMLLLPKNRWGKTHALLIEGGLTFDDIRKSVANARIAFREGVVELFELLEVISYHLLIFFLFHCCCLCWYA